MDKVVLITGGSRGIGAACSRKFAKAGATVAINYRKNEEAALSILNELSDDKHAIFRADISDPKECEGLVTAVEKKMGKIDVLINNAGIHDPHPIDTVDYGTWVRLWHETLATNLLGPANLIYCVAQNMMKRNTGHIINISSRGAFRGEPDQPAYGASKGALNSLTQSMAKKLGSFGISVTGVAPCFVETEMVADLLSSPKGEEIRSQSPFHRVAKPEDVAAAALYLASDDAKFSSGTIIDVNGASYFR